MMRRTLAGAAAALVTGTLLTAAPPSSAVEYQPWGRATSADRVLKRGCNDYPFTYRVNTPSDVWAVEVFLIGPRGGRVGSESFLGPEDPRVGRNRWRICRATVMPGRFTMKMRVTWVDPASYEKREGWVRPSYFRLTLRR